MPKMPKTIVPLKMDATVKGSRLEQMNNFVPLLLSFIISWPTRIFTPVAGLCLIIILADRLISRRLDFSVLKTQVFLLCGASALLLLVGLLYTSNIREGFAELERNSMLVLFPFFIYQCRNTTVTKTQIVFCFLAGVLVLTLYGFLYVFTQMDDAEREWVMNMGHSYYSYLFQLHPTYLAMFLLFGSFFLLEYLRKNRSSISLTATAGIIVLLAYIIFMIWFLRARVAIVAFGITGMVYPLWMIRTTLKKIAVVLAAVTILVVLAMVVDTKNVLEDYGRNGMIAMQDRIDIWRSAWEGYKLAPLFGAGTGGSQQLIDEGYLSTGYDQGLDNIYNAHNQYLQFLCRNGVPELIVFLLLCVLCYQQAIVTRSFIYFAFLFISNITMITESIMNRQKGVAFFYFFVSVFAYLKHE